MRYAQEHNEATRERILEAASRLFREQGIAAVGLAKVMAEAGLTVGTFYTHFKSKEALLREASFGRLTLGMRNSSKRSTELTSRSWFAPI